MFDHLGERRAFDELHNDEVRVAFAADVVDVHDIGVREFRRVLRFGIEPTYEFRIRGELRAQNFNRDAAP